VFKYHKVPKHWKYLLTKYYQICLGETPKSDLLVRTDFIRLCGSKQIKWLWVDKRYAWDGPSGPTIDTENFMRGSLVHDALYQLIKEGYLDKKVWRLYADKILRKICLEDGMSKFRAWYVYHSVRWFGGSHC